MTTTEQPTAESATRTPPLVLAVSLLVLALFPIGFMIKLQAPLSDPDVFWHLLLGRHLLETWDFGSVDPLSDVSTQPWLYNQWLPEVIAAWAEGWGGLPAVAWLTTLGRTGIFVAVWVAARRRADALPAILAAIVATVGAAGAFGPRPQMVGIVLLAVAVDASLRTADDGRARWWLVPLTWVWACSHGTWLFGVVIGLVVAVGSLIDRRRDPWSAHAARFAVPVLGVVAAALTPVGPRLLVASAMINDVKDLISEWQPPSLTQAPMAFVVAAIGVVVLVWLKAPGATVTWTRIGLLAFAVVATLLYVRTVAVGAMVVAPLLAEALQSLIPRPRSTVGRLEWTALGVGVTASLALAAITLPTVARDPGGAPLALQAELDALGDRVVFNDHGLGGWLLWAHPELTPVVDTRSEVFGRDYMVGFRDAQAGQPGWQAWFDRTGATAALVAEDAPIGSALVGERGWDRIGSDEGYVLLTAP